MGASRIASDLRVFKVLRQGCSLISGLLMQDFRPAGPDADTCFPSRHKADDPEKAV